MEQLQVHILYNSYIILYYLIKSSALHLLLQNDYNLWRNYTWEPNSTEIKVLRCVHSPHSWSFKKCNDHDDVTHKRAHDTEPKHLNELVREHPVQETSRCDILRPWVQYRVNSIVNSCKSSIYHQCRF